MGFTGLAITLTTDSCVCGSTVNHTAIRLKTRAALHTHCHDSRQVNLSGSSFDTLLAAYTGTAVNALMPVASNDNCTTGGSSPGASCVAFTVTQGTLYSLQVDGVNGAKGSVSIAVTFSAVNDLFSAALPVTSLPASGTTVGATLEAGEPVTVAGKNISGSVWYKFTASSNGTAKVRRRQ